MPRLDGLGVARHLRALGDRTPILMLTARHEISNRVEGLDAGADDYLVKPFALEELLARVRALLRRRGSGDGAHVLRLADLTVNAGTRQVHRGDREVHMTKTEFDLLELLLVNRRIVLSRDVIMDRIWGYNFETSSNPLEVYIGYVRRKLEAGGETPSGPHRARGRLRGQGTMSLRWRWATGLGLVAALAIGLITLAAVFSVEQRLRGAMDQDLRERAARVHELTEGLFNQGRERRGVPLPRVVNYDAILQAFDRDGNVLLRVGPEGVTPPVDDSDLEVIAGDSPALLRDVRIGVTPYRMITARALVRDGAQRTVVAIQILTDQSRLQSNLAALTGQLFLIGAIGVLLVALTGWIMASRAVRPISDLTGAAERVASTDDLDAVERVDTSAPAEIGRLATAFQSMLDSLRASRREQQRLVSDAGHEFRDADHGPEDQPGSHPPSWQPARGGGTDRADRGGAAGSPTSWPGWPPSWWT